jgi:hypothetical protein
MPLAMMSTMITEKPAISHWWHLRDWVRNRVCMGYFLGAGWCNKEGYITLLALWGNYLEGGERRGVASVRTFDT